MGISVYVTNMLIKTAPKFPDRFFLKIFNEAAEAGYDQVTVVKVLAQSHVFTAIFRIKPVHYMAPLTRKKAQFDCILRLANDATYHILQNDA